MPNSNFVNSNLKIGTWNIHALTEEKLGNESFNSFISKMHVVSFVETWCDSGKPYHDIPGFVRISYNNRIKHPKARRNSGGVIMYAKNCISKGVTKQESNHKDIIWAKLDKSFFNLKKDIFLGIIYFSPEYSLNESIDDIDERYAQLLRDIEKFSKLGDILIQGDFNAYTRTVPDFVQSDNSNIPTLEDEHYIQDICTHRNNRDKKALNGSGRLLIKLCKESSLKILNGRTLGDLLGNYTSINYKGCSVVDYSIASNDLLRNISTFNVHDLAPISDHCPISCSVLTCFRSTVTNSTGKLDPLPGKFIWNVESIRNYSENIQSRAIKQKLNDFHLNDHNDSEKAVDQLNTILFESAKLSAKFIPTRSFKKKSNKKRNQNKPWFTNSCHDLRQTVKNYCCLVNKYPENGNYRKAYYSYRSKYRRLCKKEEKSYKNQICEEISNNMQKDPKSFWKLINKLNALPENKTEDYFNEDEFINFFKEINTNKNENNHFQNQILIKLKRMLQDLESDKEEHNLNNPINKEEIRKAVKSLKNGKAAGTDYISNEMIKVGINELIDPLCKVFNLVFQTGNFPKVWNESYISLIHKKGDKHDPNNYRGISITSNLGKLFNKIIHERLMEFINDNNLISKNQIGFKPKARTADHIFSLKCMIEHYKSKKRKVFSAFIDLKKAFDTVWREGLFFILLKRKIPLKLFNIIYSMYQNTRCRIKFPNGLSHYFPSTCGVKQGDVLSPTLFNLFINGLIEDLNLSSMDPLLIGDTKVTSLMYADDIILLSESKEGLQKALDVLGNFCSSWKLKINDKKSKVIVFNSNGKTHKNYFKINNESIETVKSYCYLGILVSYTGNLNLSKTNLMEKGRKAWFKIKKTLSLDNSCSVLEKLFDTLVVPVLLYGSEVWGAAKSYKDSEPYENLHLKFAKEILGVNWNTSNSACLAELNRKKLQYKIQLNVLKFYNHILNSPNSLVFEIYENVKDKSIWTSNVRYLLNCLGYNHLNVDQLCIKSYIKRIEQRLSDQAMQNMNSSLSNNGKLDFFRLMYSPLNRPAYLDTLKLKQDRSILSKFRLSSHKLAIETGRHTKPETDRSERVCLSCNTGEVEDEYHFFSSCTHYLGLRKLFISKLKDFSIINGTKHYLSKHEIYCILNSNSYIILKITIKFIKECLEIRINK